jgi:hypothetical protein
MLAWKETFSPFMIRHIGRDLKLSIEIGRGSKTFSRYPNHLPHVFPVSGR